MMRARPTISVIIPTLQEERYIDRCLRSLVKGNWPVDDLEILVVDGGSTDGTRERVAAWNVCCPSVRLIDNPDRYVPQGINRGIEASRGEIVVFMGAHAEADPDWFHHVTEDLREHPEVAAVGGSWVIVGESAVGEAIARAQACVIGVGRNSYRNGVRPGYADTVVYGAYRREVFERHGLLDEEMVRDQDDELNVRLLARGEKLWFDPRIRVTYYSRSSYRHLWKQYYQYGFWKVRLWQKVGRLGSSRQLAPMAFVATGALALLALPLGGLATLAGAAFWGTYAAAVGLGSLTSCYRKPWLWPGVAAAVAVLHLSYGWGFWEGLFRFGLLRRGAGTAHVAANR